MTKQALFYERAVPVSSQRVCRLQSLRNLAGMVARATRKKALTDAPLEGAGLPADEHLH